MIEGIRQLGARPDGKRGDALFKKLTVNLAVVCQVLYQKELREMIII